MDTHVPQPDAFLKEQERRRQKRLAIRFYDITAWSLPLAFDVEVVASATAICRPVVPFAIDAAGPRRGAARAGARRLPAAVGQRHGGAVADALRQGLKVRTVGLGFTLAGRKYGGGTALLRASDNPADLPAALGALAAATAIDAVPIDSAFVEQGTSLGSNDVATLKAPRVLLLWDTPTQSSSAGWARYVLERRFGQPVTAVRGSSFGRADLERFDVVVLPAGSYGSVIGGETRCAG